jgi:hypothetical protein
LFELEFHDRTLLHAPREFTLRVRSMSGSRVRLALPWLPAALSEAVSRQSLPRLVTLGAWLGRGTCLGVRSSAWREWLLEAVTPAASGVLHAWAAGPSVARASGIASAGDGATWCLAQPVHLAAGVDHLRLAPLRSLNLTDADAQELAASVQARFGVTDFAVAGVVDGNWVLRFPGPVDCVTHAPDAVVGCDVHGYMPSGRDGARIRSRGNEIQMLLHEHPVNLRRARAGQLPVNGGWLWGFGVVPAQAPALAVAGWELRVADPWLRALWQGQGGPVSTPAWPLAAVQGATLIALEEPPAPAASESLLWLEQNLLLPLAAGLGNGSIARVELLLGDTEWLVRAGDRWRFWRRPARLEGWQA